ADDVLAPGPAARELVHAGGGAVEDGDGEAVALHVQDEVLAHDGQADQADVGGRCGHDCLLWCGSRTAPGHCMRRAGASPPPAQLFMMTCRWLSWPGLECTRGLRSWMICGSLNRIRSTLRWARNESTRRSVFSRL